MSIVVQVQNILNDTNVFWPLDTVLDAVNEAQWHIFAETKFSISTSTFNLSSNADIVTWPSSILIPRWVEGTNNLYAPPVIKRFFPSTQRNLEYFLRQWRGQLPGQPQVFVLWDATHWRVFPRPDANGTGPGGVYPFTLFGLGFPSEIVDSVGDIVGPAPYVQAIQNYAAAILFEITRPDLADVYLAEANNQILAFKKRLRNNQSHNIRTLRPATTRLEIEQSGDIGEIPVYYPLEA